jgi:type II secretory pathway pseudopilin PulG
MNKRLLKVHGVTLIELLGVLSIAAIVVAGLATMVNSELNDMRGEQAGAYQAQIAEAAERYIKDNYAAVLAGASPTVPTLIDLDALKSTHYLPNGVSATNAYGQAPCVLALQPQPGKVQALVLTRGGDSIPEKQRALVAAQSGKGGGSIGAATPLTAQGAFGSWQMPLAGYSAATCVASPQHLASAIFFDGPSTSAVDFVYRNRVPDHPELNDMNVPLGMQYVAAALQTDTYCGPTVASSIGRIAADSSGNVLSCDGDKWRRQGSAFWKDPVPTAAQLPFSAASVTGDVIMTLDDLMTYKWDGAAWTPLAVDRQGNLSVPNALSADTAQLRKIVLAGDACDSNGLIARDATGSLMSCQTGVWKVQGSMEIESLDRDLTVILPSPAVPYGENTVFYSGPITYLANDDWYQVLRSRTIFLKRDGVVTFNGWAIMNRMLIGATGQKAKVWLHVQIFDNDTGSATAIANSKSMSTTLHDETSVVNTTLAQPLPKNTNGYQLVVDLRWTTLDGSGGVGHGIYNRATWSAADGSVKEETPLLSGWTLDTAY